MTTAPAGQPADPAGLDPVLLEVLACPAEHHAPLRMGDAGDPKAAALTCTRSRSREPLSAMSIPVPSDGGTTVASAMVT